MRRSSALAILFITIFAILLCGCTSPAPAAVTTTPVPEAGHSSDNPAPIGQAVTGNSKQKLPDGSTITMTLVLENVTRGDAAEKLLDSYTGLPQTHRPGNEFLFAEFKADMINYTPGENYSISNYNFAAIADGVTTNATPIILFNPTIQGNIKKGETREGWVLFEMPANSTNPVIAYARASDGSGGLWFRAY